MLKKLTAYSFILLANIVLLAHAVLPHHHHEQQVCIVLTHCVNDEESHSHTTPAQDHQHDGSNNTDTCILKQVVFIPSSQGKYLNNFENCTDNHTHDYFDFSNFMFEDLQPFSVAVASIPEFSSFFISYVTPALGLRAPPIV